MPPEVNDDTQILSGMIEVLGKNSRLVGQGVATIDALVACVMELPTRRQFILACVIGGIGIALAVVVAVIALVVAVAAI